MKTRTKTAVGVVAVLLVAGAAWAMLGRDTVVDEMHREAQQVFSGDADDEQRRAFRERVGQLSEDQRRQLFERGRPQMQQRIAKRMNDLMNLPPDELRREVADRADAIIAARAERATRGDGDRGGRPPGPPGGGDGGDRRKRMLDFIPATTRAQFTSFRSMVNQELEARGEDPMSGRDMRAMFRGGRGRT